MSTVTPQPQPVNPKSGTYQQESNTFGAVSDAFRFLGSARLRISKRSPPVVNKDVSEGQFILDRTTNKVYTVINGVLKGVTLS